MDTFRVTVVLGLLAIAATGVSAVSCFQCNSHLEPECLTLKQNDTSSRFYKPCKPTEEHNGKPLFCRKTVQNIFEYDVQHTRIIRSCAWVRYPSRDCYSFKNKGHEEESCTCYHDACNSASTMSSIILLPIISTIILNYK